MNKMLFDYNATIILRKGTAEMTSKKGMFHLDEKNQIVAHNCKMGWCDFPTISMIKDTGLMLPSYLGEIY